MYAGDVEWGGCEREQEGRKCTTRSETKGNLATTKTTKPGKRQGEGVCSRNAVGILHKKNIETKEKKL